MFCKPKYFFIILYFIIALLTTSCKKNIPDNNLDKIIIIKYEESKAYDTIEMGIIDQLNISEIELDIKTYNAYGREESLILALNEAKSMSPLAIITISEIATMSALSLLTTNNTIFFGVFAVDDINRIYRHNNKYNNIKGVYKIESIIPYIKKIKIILDKMESIGYLYDIENTNSIRKSKYMHEAFEKEGLEYSDLPIENESNITNNYSDIIAKLDAIYLDIDLIKYINEDNIKYLPPLITTDNEVFYYENILLSINLNYYRAGRMLADTIIELTEKRSLDKIKNIEIKDSFDIHINKTVLNNLNIIINTNKLHTNTRIIYIENFF